MAHSHATDEINSEVLLLILTRAGGTEISRTRLLKLSYMADLFAWRVLGAPMSGFEYHRYKHGPFDSEFYRALDALVESGRVEVEEKTTIEGYDCSLFRAVAGTHGLEAGFSFTPGQVHLVDTVIQRYGSMNLKEFMDQVVYQTQPMKTAPPNARLPMEEEKDKDRAAVGGISLETILESQEAFGRGESVAPEELLSSIDGMRLCYSPGVADKMRAFLKAWGIHPKGIALEINEHIERLADNPSLGGSDPERNALFAGAKFYSFKIERPPIVKRVTVAYQVSRDEAGPVLQVLDVSPLDPM